MSESVQRQLVQDIINNGGIDKAKLEEIYNAKPDIYGPPSSKVRRQVGQKIYKWKQKDHAQLDDLFKKILNTQQLAHPQAIFVTPPAEKKRMDTLKSPGKYRQPRKDDIDSDDSDDDNAPSFSTMAEKKAYLAAKEAAKKCKSKCLNLNTLFLHPLSNPFLFRNCPSQYG